MFKKTNLIFLSLVLSTQLSGAILTGNDGIKYITLGSTQDEVLKILGKPSCISCSGSYWEYGSDYLKFENGRVVKCSNPKALRMKLSSGNHHALKI